MYLPLHSMLTEPVTISIKIQPLPLRPDGPTSSSTLVNAIATGNVIYYNGSYWATPDYVSSLKNMRVVYENDNSNTSDTSKQEYQGYEGLFTNLEIIEPQTTENKFDLDGIS